MVVFPNWKIFISSGPPFFFAVREKTGRAKENVHSALNAQYK